MGLQTTNYEVKKLGITLPNAYAVVHKLTVDGESGTAEFHVQTSRENAFAKEPIEKVFVSFEVERDENPLVQAYTAAKAVKMVKRWVPIENASNGVSLQDVEVQMPFYGWEDDIVEPIVEEVEEETAMEEPIINPISEDETGGEEEIVYE